MLPEYLKEICIELESMIELQSLSFRKNVLRENPNSNEWNEVNPNRRNKSESMLFAEALANLVKTAQALVHLDISGMFLGDEKTRTILCDGVAESKTMAAVHFADNQLTHWTRIQIYHQMTRPRDKSDLQFYNESPVHGQTFGRND